MRYVVQFSVFQAWLLSFAETWAANRWLDSDRPLPHLSAVVVLLLSVAMTSFSPSGLC